MPTSTSLTLPAFSRLAFHYDFDGQIQIEDARATTGESAADLTEEQAEILVEQCEQILNRYFPDWDGCEEGGTLELDLEQAGVKLTHTWYEIEPQSDVSIMALSEFDLGRATREAAEAYARRLRNAKATHMRVNYEGIGDEGAPLDLSVFVEGGEAVALGALLDIDGINGLESVLYDMIQSHHGGYENGEGGGGEINWDLVTGILTYELVDNELVSRNQTIRIPPSQDLLAKSQAALPATRPGHGG